MGYQRMFYPGGNTCRGFHSFYDYIIAPDATRIFVIKGGPGVGKSSFMKALGAELHAMGHNIELHWCSSDNDSLDGLVLPDYAIALLDGTSPHVVDPKNPGCVDEIVHLGDYWQEPLLVANKDRILSYNQLVARYFRLAYIRLREARSVWSELAECTTGAVSDAALFEMSRILRRLLLDSAAESDQIPAKSRHLFASAITPGGIQQKLSTLIEPDFRIIALRGLPGFGVRRLLSGLQARAADENIPAEVYHSPFDPAWPEALIFRSAKTAIVDDSGLISDYAPLFAQTPAAAVYDLSDLADHTALIRFETEIGDALNRLAICLQAAVGFIHLAKLTHDEMETCYIPAMDFSRVDEKRREILARILGYIEQAKQASV